MKALTIWQRARIGMDFGRPEGDETRFVVLVPAALVEEAKQVFKDYPNLDVIGLTSVDPLKNNLTEHGT